jgi:hypothetical protein
VSVNLYTALAEPDPWPTPAPVTGPAPHRREEMPRFVLLPPVEDKPEPARRDVPMALRRWA